MVWDLNASAKQEAFLTDNSSVSLFYLKRVYSEPYRKDGCFLASPGRVTVRRGSFPQ